MTAGARAEAHTPATDQPLPSDAPIIAAFSQRPLRLPGCFYVATYRKASGRTESAVYRQRPAALRHVERLTDQGFSVTLSVCTAQSWSSSTYLPAVLVDGLAGRSR